MLHDSTEPIAAQDGLVELPLQGPVAGGQGPLGEGELGVGGREVLGLPTDAPQEEVRAEVHARQVRHQEQEPEVVAIELGLGPVEVDGAHDPGRRRQGQADDRRVGEVLSGQDRGLIPVGVGVGQDRALIANRLVRQGQVDLEAGITLRLDSLAMSAADELKLRIVLAGPDHEHSHTRGLGRAHEAEGDSPDQVLEVPRHAEGALNGVHDREGQLEAALAARSRVPEQDRLFHVADPADLGRHRLVAHERVVNRARP